MASKYSRDIYCRSDVPPPKTPFAPDPQESAKNSTSKASHDGHLIALEPRMMFDGAAVATATTTLATGPTILVDAEMAVPAASNLAAAMPDIARVEVLAVAPEMPAADQNRTPAIEASDLSVAASSENDGNSIDITLSESTQNDAGLLALDIGEAKSDDPTDTLIISQPVVTDVLDRLPADGDDVGSSSVAATDELVTSAMVTREALPAEAISSAAQNYIAPQPVDLSRSGGIEARVIAPDLLATPAERVDSLMSGGSPGDLFHAVPVLTEASATPSRDFIFIDSNVENYQELVDAWTGRGQIILLDSNRDGVEQILAALAGTSNIGAIHLVSHGEEGAFWLGNTQIDSEALSGSLAASFAAIGSKLAPTGDILIYGCDVGADEAGRQLLNALAAITGADIAASIDDTGSILRGGDWTLENRVGQVESTSLIARDWDGLLAPTALSVQSGQPDVVDGNGNAVPSTTRVGANATATWDNVGRVNGQQISLRATIVSISANDNIEFSTVGDDPNFLLRAFGSPTTATAEIRWDIFFTNSGAPVPVDVSFTVADIDGVGNNERSREWVTVDTDTLSSFQNANGSNILFDTSIPGEVTASGTQNEVGAARSAARFNWLDTSSFTITYNLDPNAASAAGFRHDGDLDFNLGRGGTTVSIPRLDLDRNDSTATGSAYMGSFVENDSAVGIVDSDVRITNPDGSVQNATVTLTNAQAGDRLLVNGSTASSGTLAGGISYTRTDTGVTFTGAANANRYQNALRAISFESVGERPSTVDRNITISFANAALSSNIATSTIKVTEINDPPTAVDDPDQTTPENTPITGINVLGNDFDGDGDPLTVIGASAGNGVVTIGPGGVLNYTPNAQFFGTDTITYTISDGRGGTSTATVDIIVTEVNDPPQPVGSLPPQSNVDAAQGIFVGTSQGFQDPDNGFGELTYSATGLPPGLSIDSSTGAITGTLDNSASQGGNGGVYNVTVTATDPEGGSASQSFSWTVTNPPPQANNDGGSTNEDTPITVDVLANDQDPDGDDITVVAATANNGTVVINPDGTLTYTPNPDFNGSDTITYTISDGEGGTDTAIFDMTVVAVNDAPVPDGTLPPQSNQDADGGISVQTASGFSDQDGPSISYSATGLPPGLSINSTTGEITGTIDNSASQGGVNGVYTVTISATDFQSTPATQIFTWTVTNPGPSAADDSASTDEDTAVTVNVLANDNDPDGDDLSVIAASADNGIVVINPDGTITYMPNADFNGSDTITYTISDGEGGTSTATVTVTVDAVNDAPQPNGALPPQVNEDADGGISLDTAGAFTDRDDATLTYSVTGLPAGLSIDSSTGEITGTIDRSASQGGANGVYSVTVTATDAGGLSATQMFSWTVTNPGPVAVDDSATTTEDTPVTIDVLPNDSDPDGDPLTLIAAAASVGQATVVGNQVTYTPPSNFNGTATITYTISDGEGGTATATITVTVTAENDAPTANPLPPQTTEDGATISVPVAGAFDDVDGDSLTFSASDLPPGLSIDPDSGVISGTIDNSASQTNGGAYTATITADDGNGGTVSQTISFTVTNPGPVAVDDSASTDEDTPVTLNPLANDSDPDGDDLSVTAATADNGTVVINPDGTLTYTPNPGFNGTDRINYEISDGEGGIAMAVITIAVADVNDTPTTTGSIGDQTNLDSQLVSLPVAGAFSDPDGDSLSFTATGLPAGLTIDPDTGVISGKIDRSASQTNGGIYNIIVTADDGRGGTVSTSFTWTVTNPAPVASNDSVTTDEDTTVQVAVLANDVDSDGDPLTVIEAEAGNGTVQINPDGTIAYTPNQDFNGEDTIIYTISDGEGGFSTATVTVTVTPVNDAPTTSGLPNQNGDDGTSVSIPTAQGFDDVDGDDLTFTATGLPPSLSIDPDTGLITGTLDSDTSVNGPFIVTVTATDPSGESVSTSFVYSVQNIPPIAVDDTATTPEDVPVTVAVLTNDSDPDGDPLTITSASTTDGTVVVNADGTLTFTPAENFNGQAVVTYTVSDGQGGMATATLTVDVVAVNDAPDSLPIPDVTNEDNQSVSVDTSSFFSDVDGDTLAFSATNLPAGLSIDPATGIISGTIDRDASQPNGGVYSVTVTATDPDGLTTSQTFTWTVTNPAPTAANDSATTDEDTPVTVNVLGNDNDPDGDPLTVTMASAPNGTVVINPDGTLTYTPNADFNGTDTITYVISDGNGGTSTAAVIVTVNPVNDAPLAVDDVATTNEDTPVTIAVLGNDSDPDGDPLTVTNATSPDGTVVINPDGTVTFTPNPDFNGPTTITYTISDGNGGTSTATVNIIVDAVNDPPVAVPDSATTDEDTPVTIGVLGNDSDIDGDPLTVTAADAPNGTVVINPDGTITYTPNPDFNGTDTITYTISDGQGGFSTTTVTVTVNAVNDAPVATPIAPQTNDDADNVNLSVAANFTDVDGDSLTFTATGLPPGLSIDAAGNITGTIDPSASQGGPGGDGIYSVTVTADDGNGGTVSQTFSWVVDNPAPVATDEMATTDEDTPVTINVLANDSDPDGDMLTVIAATAGNGLVTINPNGTLTYTPNANFNGSDTITYTISDGEGGTSTATVTITVDPVNDAPTVDQPLPNLTGVDGEVASIPTAGNFSDLDGDTLSFSATGLPAGLTIDPDTGEISGTIDNQASQVGGGIYTVTVTADDGNGGTASSTFTYTITNPGPVAADDVATTDEDTPVNIAVLANDSDPDGDDLTVTTATAANGTVVIEADGTLTYTPNGDFNGTDTITYTISDGNGGFSTATVTVTVAPVNDGPQVDLPLSDLNNADADTVSVDLGGKFSDIDGDTLTITATGLPPGLSIDADGLITGTIDREASQANGGVYQVTITADDGNGGTVSADFTWIVTNPAPTASDDVATTTEDTPSTPIAVLANDNDPDGDPLTVISATAPNGTVVINPDGTLVYTPAENFNGTDVITYTVSDGNGGTATATVTVTVVAANDAPEVDAQLGNRTNVDGAVIAVDVSGNFSDLDGDMLSFSATGLPAGLSIDANGNITGTIDPAASQVNGGIYMVTVTADDGNGGTVSSTFTWTITNPAPVAADDVATTDEDMSVNIAVLTNDNDPDGDALTVIAAAADNGTVVIEADGTLTYQPNGNFNGTDTVVYTISDGEGGTSTATVTVTVNAINDAPETVGLPDLFDSNSEVVVVPLGPAFSDAEDPNLTFSATGLPPGLSIDPNTGQVVGQIGPTASSDVPGGLYTVTVTATDDQGLSVDTTFSWTITNEPPRANNDSFIGTEDTPLNLDVLANDVDPDGDPNTPIEIVDATATNGTIVILADGTIDFTPEPDFNGIATVTYTIQDANGEFATAVATITIAPVNDAPEGTILPDRQGLDGDAVNLPFGDLFSDPEGDPLVFSAANLPPGLSIDAAGNITGTIDPDASQNGGGVYQVEITATDNGGLATTQSFLWTIGNPGPTAVDDTASTTEDTPSVPIAVLANDNDPDGDALTVTDASAPNGTVVINPDGTLTYTPDANFNGTDIITYQISDGQGGTSTAIVTVTVGAENDPPTVTDLPARSNADADAVNLPVADNFDDLDGDTLTFTATGLPPGLSIDGAGNITGTIDPAASQGGPDGDGIYSVTVTADDGNGGTVSTTFAWTVTNPPPVAVNDGPVAVIEDTPTPITVLANDNDPDGDPLTVTFATAGHGDIVINPDGTLTYAPDQDYNGPDTITYTISDGNGGTSTATVTVNVSEVNDDPVATPIAPQNNVDGATISLPVATNFTDIDGDALTFSASGLPAGLTIDPNTGVISGTIDSGASQIAGGVYTVTVTASDGRGGTVDQNFTFTVTNPLPVAANDSAATNEDTLVNIAVLGNDFDPDGDALTVTTASAANGTVVILADGTIDYTPDADFNGTDTITYTISDGNGGTATATVTVAVGAENDPPVAVNDSAVTDEESPVTIPVLANDSDIDGDPLTVIDASAPNGTVTINPDGTITYVPDDDFTGTDTITYTISDGQGGTSIALVTVTVNPVNDDPVAVDDVASTPEDTPVTLNVLANDRDVDGDPLTVTGATSPDGQVVINPDGTIRFTPDPDFNGVTTITYTISDGNGGTATATVTLTVDPVNDPPVAQPDVAQTDEDTPVIIPLLANDSDADGDPLTVTAATAANGSVTINPDGTVTYVPDPDFNGTDTITYTISDGNGGFATSTVSVTVNPVNDVPVAIDDVATVPEDSPVTIPVLANDSDADGDPLTVADATSPDGTVVINPDGTITFTPNPDFNGPTTITYTVSDGQGGTTTATVTVNVTPVNDPPVTQPGVGVTNEDVPVILSPLDNATDAEGDPLTIISATSPNGTVTINPDGTITYVPDPDFNGTDVITYQVSDGQGGFRTEIITMTVNPVNDPPVAANDVVTTDEERPVTIPVLANDSDADGDPLTVTAATAANGTVTINPDGTVTYVPNTDFFGTDTISYTISDGNGGTSTATVTVNVRNTNEPPVDLPENVFGIGGADTVIDVLANASDPDGDSLSVFTAKVDIGTVTINPDGTITHVAPPEFQGVATITYIISDGQGGFVESTATVIVTQANADINALLGDDGGLGFPDSEPPSEILDQSDAFISVPLIIDDTVNGFRSLGPTPDLGGERPLLTAVNGLRSLGGLGSFDVDGYPIDDVVRYLDEIRDLRFGADRLFDPRFGDFLVEGLTGFSVRQLETGNDQIMIESVARDRVIYMEIRDIGGDADPRISEYQLRTRDGSPLPSWIRMDARGLAIIERPVDAETIRLIVRAIRADGQIIEIPVVIQGATGEIQIDKDIELSMRAADPATLGSSMALASKSVADETAQLLAAFKA